MATIRKLRKERAKLNTEPEFVWTDTFPPELIPNPNLNEPIEVENEPAPNE